MTIPSNKILQQMAKASYDSNHALIPGWRLIYKTPTITAYLMGRVIVLAIRGTADAIDAHADIALGLGNLEISDRYRKDESDIRTLQKRFPISRYIYYATGHSLGGAINDLLIRNGLIRSAVSFNPAVEPNAVKNTNKRIYIESDPLYQTLVKGQQKPIADEVRPSIKPDGLHSFLKRIPLVGNTMSELYHGYKSHQIDNFEGGLAYQLGYETPPEWLLE